MSFTKSRVSFLVSVIVILYITFNYCHWRDQNMLKWDSSYYYLYLPATIIYHDLGKLEFYPAKIHQYNINRQNPTYELYPQAATGRVTNKYAVGVSVCELPFFLLAHEYCLLFHPEQADGFTEPYRVAMAFCQIIWVITGLFFLRKMLLRYFSETATAITLLLAMFATNLYFYSVLDMGSSHAPSFSLFCLLLYATERAYSTGKNQYIIATGALLGMIAITRPTNIIMAIFPLFWPYNKTGRLQFFKDKKWAVIASIAAFTAISFIQLGYLKYTSGHWFHFSYQEEGFDFLHPEIINGLFSYRKGWFIYTPVAFIAVLGLIPLFRKNRQFAIIISIYLLVAIYIIFSWCQWAYGGSFSCRPLIESVAVISIPLAAFIERIFATKNTALKTISLVVFSFFITLNVFQSYQLMNNVLPWDSNTKAYYWRVFGKLEVTNEDRELLKVE